MNDWFDDESEQVFEPDIQEWLDINDADLAETNQPEGQIGEKATPWRDAANPSARGSAFEHWCNENIMDNRAERLRVPGQLNEQLGLTTQNRQSDDYWVRENAIWDFKCGYEQGRIEKGQLADYQKIVDAEQVTAVKNGVEQTRVIESVNYLFDTRSGALNNQERIEATGSERIFIWYLDAENQPQLLSNDYAQRY